MTDLAHHTMVTASSDRTPSVSSTRLRATPMAQFTCLGCGYGACCRIAPERCPMCGGSTWEHVDPPSPDDTTRRV